MKLCHAFQLLSLDNKVMENISVLRKGQYAQETRKRWQTLKSCTFGHHLHAYLALVGDIIGFSYVLTYHLRNCPGGIQGP